MENPDCAIDTGTCEYPAPGHKQTPSIEPAAPTEVIYVGDPMCSWCWGIAPALRKLQQYCQQQNLTFRVLVGGLRPGGGDPWSEDFKQFLAHHWHEVSKRTGQMFNTGILKWDLFDYDTEPACRSVVVARSLRPGIEFDFFAAVQRKFYVENEDPKLREFYRGICAELELDFGELVRRFDSDEFKTLTQQEFQQSRSWGISAFPSVLLHTHGLLSVIARGYSSFDAMRDKLDGVRGRNNS